MGHGDPQLHGISWRPKVRADKGVCRGLSAEESATILEYLEHDPELTAEAFLRPWFGLPGGMPCFSP